MWFSRNRKCQKVQLEQLGFGRSFSALRSPVQARRDFHGSFDSRLHRSNLVGTTAVTAVQECRPLTASRERGGFEKRNGKLVRCWANVNDTAPPPAKKARLGQETTPKTTFPLGLLADLRLEVFRYLLADLFLPLGSVHTLPSKHAHGYFWRVQPCRLLRNDAKPLSRNHHVHRHAFYGADPRELLPLLSKWASDSHIMKARFGFDKWMRWPKGRSRRVIERSSTHLLFNRITGSPKLEAFNSGV